MSNNQPPTNDPTKQAQLKLDDHLVDLLEGTASDEVLDFIAESDTHRDARYEAEQGVSLTKQAGADFVLPEDFEQRLLRTLDSEPEAQLDAPQSSERPAPSTASVAPISAAPQASRPSEGGEAPATLEMAALAEESSEELRAEAPSQSSSELIQAPKAQPNISPEKLSKAASNAESKRGTTPSEASGQADADEPVDDSAKPTRGFKYAYLLVPALAAAAGALIWAMPKTSLPSVGTHEAAWQGAVQAFGPGLESCAPSGDRCEPLTGEAPLKPGGYLRTDRRTQAELRLSDGSHITLDRDTELSLNAKHPRLAKLHRGRLVADIARVPERLAQIELPNGKITVLGTKFAATSQQETSRVEVSRGLVRLSDQTERSVEVRAGEEARIEAGSPPLASQTRALAEAIAWSDMSERQEEERHDVRGLGELRAKKPGDTEEQKGAVRLTSHQIKVRIVGPLARTEIEEVFTNQTDDVLEGIFRFPIPPDAQIDRLALEVDGKLEEGAFVDRDRAAAIWRGTIVNAAPKVREQIRDEIIWVPGPWKDPALLEWQRGGRFELRVFPIPKRGSRRVVLAYTQVLKPSGNTRRYIYPLAHDPSGTTQVERFGVDLQVRDFDEKLGVSTQGYDLTDQSKPGDPHISRGLSASTFQPNGDLVVEYALPNRESALTAWTYKPTEEDRLRTSQFSRSQPVSAGVPGATLSEDKSYAAITIRPNLPRSEEGFHRDYSIVVDASRSMFGERYERAVALTSKLIRELDGQDRVTVLACDSLCRTLSGGMRSPGADTAELAAQFLKAEAPEGGSDIGAALDAAKQAVPQDSSRKLRVVYIGDGTPTVGVIRPAYVQSWAQRSLAGRDGSITAVAIGTDSDLDTLSAMTRGGGGAVVPFVPGQRVSEAAFSILSATYGNNLSDVRVELPEGLLEIAPTELDSVLAGGEQLVVARMRDDQVKGDVILRGKFAGKEFEERYPLDLKADSHRGNTFVPRLYAATKITDLERSTSEHAKRDAIQLSQRFNVASRYTSLLVLESPAMFKAFGLDNTRYMPEWSGEENVFATESRSDQAGKKRADSAGPQDMGAAEESAFDDDFGPLGFGAPAPTSAARAGNFAPSPAAPPRKSEMADARSAPPRQRMIAMRRVWERAGEISTDKLASTKATADRLASARSAVTENDNHRGKVKELYQLLAVSGDLSEASQIAEHWSAKDPLDPDALTARADLLARNGERDRAIRLLGSVIDIRPGDIAGQQRLARLYRWAGHPEQGCRYSLAIAQIKADDSKLLADALRCSRSTSTEWLGEQLTQLAGPSIRAVANRLASQSTPEDQLSGDFRVEATWSGGSDLDIALLHPDGHRVSWLGAPTRSVITATHVTSTEREGLALRGAKPGEYLVEIVRANGMGPVSGTVTIVAGQTTRNIPFTLTEERQTVARVTIQMRSRLVPASAPTSIEWPLPPVPLPR